METPVLLTLLGFTAIAVKVILSILVAENDRRKLTSDTGGRKCNCGERLRPDAIFCHACGRVDLCNVTVRTSHPDGFGMVDVPGFRVVSFSMKTLRAADYPVPTESIRAGDILTQIFDGTYRKARPGEAPTAIAACVTESGRLGDVAPFRRAGEWSTTTLTFDPSDNPTPGKW